MSSIDPASLATFREHLHHITPFTDEEWSVFSEYLYIRSLRKKELLVASGKVCNEVCFILEGSFRFYFDRDGMEISNYFCFTGELISSYPSFLQRSPSPANVEALENASLICFTYEGLQQMLAHPVLAFRMERLGRLLAEYLLICYEERLFSFIIQTPEQRYVQLLSKQPNLVQRIPQHYVANYLGITPVSLSRIRRRIQRGQKAGV